MKNKLWLKIILTSIFFIGCVVIGNAQNTGSEIFTEIDEMPEFPGGQAKLMNWLAVNIRYPDAAQQNGVQGRVTVRFVVEKDGSLSGVRILKGVDKDLDAEAIRVVKRMPRWQPGRKNGEPVRSEFSLPVTFKLSNQ